MFGTDTGANRYLGVGCLNEKLPSSKTEHDVATGVVQAVLGVIEVAIGATVLAGAAVAIGPASIAVGLIAGGALTFGVGVSGAVSGKPISSRDLQVATLLANPLNALLVGDLLKLGVPFDKALKIVEVKETVDLLEGVLTSPTAPENLLGVEETFRSELMSRYSSPDERVGEALIERQGEMKSDFSLYGDAERRDAWSFEPRVSKEPMGKMSECSD